MCCELFNSPMLNEIYLKQLKVARDIQCHGNMVGPKTELNGRPAPSNKQDFLNQISGQVHRISTENSHQL